MIKKSSGPHCVSANNTCPSLRALVASGKLADDREPLARVAAVVAATARAGDGHPVLPRTAIFAIASVASGLGPLSLVDTQWHGLQLNALRGVSWMPRKCRGQRASPRRSPPADGSSELGLGLAELRASMDANFARAAGCRRMIDRTLMIGKWPVLLKVMGKAGPDGRYLVLQDIIDLFRQRSFPERMNKRLRAGR